MARNTLSKVVSLRDGRKAYFYEAVITSVPAGASQSGSLDKLPAGHYQIFFFGTQTAAGTDPTLAIEGFVDVAQSDVFELGGGLFDDTAATAAVDLEVAKTSFSGIFGAAGGLGMVHIGAFLPYGAKWTYTKQGGTAIDLTIVFVEA